jgi:hypothetical protein
VKGFASGMVFCTGSATIFLVVKVFPVLVVSIGPHGVYYLFATVCLITSAYSCVVVPETDGKSMAELHVPISSTISVAAISKS